MRRRQAVRTLSFQFIQVYRCVAQPAVHRCAGKIWKEKVTEDNPPRKKSPVGQLGSGPRLVGRIGSELLISSRFQMFALRMLLLCVGLGDFFLSVFIHL